MDNSTNINRSYVFYRGYDKGPRYLFTYFFEINTDNTVFTAVAIVLYMLIYLGAFWINMFVFGIVYKANQRKAKGNNYYILSLSLAGILSSSSIPLVVAAVIQESWIFGDIVCKVNFFLMFAGCIMSMWNTVIISIDRRYIARKKRPLTCRQAKLALLFLWTAAVGSALLPTAFSSVYDHDERTTVCTIIWIWVGDFTILTVVTVFILGLVVYGPFVLILYNYIQVIKMLGKSLSQFKNASEQSFFVRALFSKDREMRTIRLLIGGMVVLVSMWVPISVWYIILLYDELTTRLLMTSQMFMMSLWFTLLKVCLNVFFHAYFNKASKADIQRFLRRVAVCCRPRTGVQVGPDLQPGADTRTDVNPISSNTLSEPASRLHSHRIGQETTVFSKVPGSVT